LKNYQHTAQLQATSVCSMAKLSLLDMPISAARNEVLFRSLATVTKLDSSLAYSNENNAHEFHCPE
jgi:hypothetical protein